MNVAWPREMRAEALAHWTASLLHWKGLYERVGKMGGAGEVADAYLSARENWRAARDDLKEYSRMLSGKGA